MNVVFEKKNDILRRMKAPDLRRFSYYRWMLTDAWPAKDVRMYDLTEPMKERYDTEKDEFREAQKTLDKKKLFASLLAEIIKRSGEIIFTAFVVMQAFDGKISIGNVALYIGFALSATNSFQSLVTVLVFAYKITSDRMGHFFRFIELDTPTRAKDHVSLALLRH
jgi:ABC-type multidrug transport system fused ATPase/permease subunit